MRRSLGTRHARNSTAVSVIGSMVLALGGGGCSFLFSEGAPADHERRTHFVCATSYAPPVLDTIAAGLFGLVANADPDESLTQQEQDGVRAIQIGAALVAAGAAVYGYMAVSDCRQATAMREADVARSRFLPPPYGVAPYGTPPLYWPPPPRAPVVPLPSPVSP
jgi:hypothetical protein